MKKFLEKIAAEILKLESRELIQTRVILPNRRSEVFLRDHLKRLSEKSIILPEILTIDKFMVRSSGINIREDLQLYFDLFTIHKEIAGDKARPVEEFLTWAPIMLADFNDIDLYLADPEQVFGHLSEARAISSWNLDRKPLTQMQSDYIEFYNSLYDYYRKLKDHLQQASLGFKGMAYRHLAEKIGTITKDWKKHRYLVVGFNALSEAEIKVFDYLKENFETDFYFDIDDYFLTDTGKLEAGRFLSRFVDRWSEGKPNWIESNLRADGDKSIQVVSVTKRIGQVKFAAEKLKTDFAYTSPSTDPGGIDTAIVLADEKMLTPLLNSLPEIHFDGDTVGYNITMGFPMANSPFSTLITDWTELLVSRQEHPYRQISVRQLVVLLNNPIIRLIADAKEEKNLETYLHQLYRQSAVFLSKSELLKSVEQDNTKRFFELLNILLVDVKSATNFVDALIKLLQFVKTAFESREHRNIILNEMLLSATAIAKQLQILSADLNETLSLKALQRVINQLLRRLDINLKGEPLSGIQVMGMLETRNLDFSNIILLSANEGILPKTESIESFIPFDIRSVYKLPLPKDKTDVFSYHFFRLMQRAKNITVVYNSVADELGGGEKSRYLLQLKNELLPINPQIRYTENILTLPVEKHDGKEPIAIEKNDRIIELIRKKLKSGLSPTSLSSYIKCPLQFHFSYLLKLKPPDELEQEVEANVFGSVVHGVLEEIYKPFAGGTIITEKLKAALSRIDQLLDVQFGIYYPGGDLSQGKNLLIGEVARKYVEQFVKTDLKNLEREPRSLVSVEEKLKLPFGDGFVLTGKIDRIDRSETDDSIRLVDYKTGSVLQSSDLKLKDWEELTTDPKFEKVFQLLFYSYLYTNTKAVTSELKPGIFSLRRHSLGFQEPILPESGTLSEALDHFEAQVTRLIGDLLDEAVVIEQTDNEEICNWCDYKSICNRQGKSAF